jgi:hypothetical protein
MTGFEGSGPVSRRPFGSLLCFTAAVLALLGSFQPLITIRQDFPGGRFESTATGWTTRVSDPQITGAEDTTVLNGVPLTVAALVLLVAALLGLRTAPWAAHAGIARVVGPAAGLGAAFLAGTVGTIGMQLLPLVRGSLGSSEPPFTIEVIIGAGFWMLVAAVVVAVMAALHSWRRAPASAVREEPDTPVLGIPVVTRLPDEPQHGTGS